LLRPFSSIGHRLSAIAYSSCPLKLKVQSSRSRGIPHSALRTPHSYAAFTLIEILLALSVSAIVLAAIGGVFYSAIRLRERTTAALDESAPLYHALTLLRRDLQGVLPPGGVLAGDFKAGTVDNGMAQGPGLQFCSSTGVIKDEEPWGDIQQVTYELRNPVERTSAAGKDLFRSVTRNLLATTSFESQDQWLMGNVQTLEFSCYDGAQWSDSWDTSLGNTNLPSAVLVRILLAADNSPNPGSRQPIEIIVPLVTQPRLSQTASTGGGQ
jgi:type II secretory pathway component PulJ